MRQSSLADMPCACAHAFETTMLSVLNPWSVPMKATNGIPFSIAVRSESPLVSPNSALPLATPANIGAVPAIVTISTSSPSSRKYPSLCAA